MQPCRIDAPFSCILETVYSLMSTVVDLLMNKGDPRILVDLIDRRVECSVQEEVTLSENMFSSYS